MRDLKDRQLAPWRTRSCPANLSRRWAARSGLMWYARAGVSWHCRMRKPDCDEFGHQS
ncbi:hypothetical protein [Microvirga sp. VF16]|uniref:hypothetical protein n=1 Tax=Microvirga sp. VF16 TaxID=2807101 RepID=UPI0035302A03